MSHTYWDNKRNPNKYQGMTERVGDPLRQLTALADMDDLTGKKVYFSGTFPWVKHELMRVCDQLGIEFATGFSRNKVDVLVVADAFGSAKIPKAEAWGMPIITAEIFFALPGVREAAQSCGLRVPENLSYSSRW